MWSALSKIGIVVAVVAAFVTGLTGTVYLSLRSPEVHVPDVTGQNLYAAREVLEGAGLHVRERARRFKMGAAPDTILDQSPRPGEVIKEGQTVAIVVSRAPKEGESPTSDEIVEQKPPEPSASPANNNTRNTNDASAKNQNQNQNKDKRRNANNKNANNKNVNNQNGNNQNGNRNANRNSNANTNRNANANNRNANTNRTPTGNRNATRNTNTSNRVP